MIRALALAAAAVGLLRFRASGDYRYAPLAAATGAGFGLGYLGGYLPVHWPVSAEALS